MAEDNQASETQAQDRQPEFIDVFAGCGGLALGLMQAGWRGLFAIEKSPMAFETLKHNLIDQEDQWQFDWPDWLPTNAIDIQSLLRTYREELERLKGLALLVGGPPCEGFSVAGRRNPEDDRNRLFNRYLDLVDLVEPRMLLIENVRGFATAFDKTERGAKGEDIQGELFNADKELRQQLNTMGYRPYVRRTLMARDFGVPQLRPRYILIAISKTMLKAESDFDPFKVLYDLREEYLSERGLPTEREVNLEEAISDLMMTHGYVPCIEPRMKRFGQGLYGPIESEYQKLMRKHRNGEVIDEGEVADSHRFPNHNQPTIDRFRRILAEFRPGIQLREDELRQLNLNKHRIAPLAPDEACHTLTSLPDDLIHYCEPRVPTVREYARIQSFPDWFEFKSAYTTGGERRRIQVPRYTQVANAVPPLLAEALGRALLHVYMGRHSLLRPTGLPVQLELALKETIK